MYTIYAHKNLRNEKYYVGCTKLNPKKRWNNGKGYKNQPKIWADIQNSDWDSDWQHGILGKFENEQDALKYESFLIAMLDTVRNGYNTSAYDSHSCKHSEETKKKISESLTGEKNPNFGKHFSEETRKRMSDNHADLSGENHPMFGKHHTEETKSKMSKSSHSKPVLQYSKEGELIAEYLSTKEAERLTGCYHGHICKCCKGRLKTCGGFIWRYKKS